MPHKSRKHVSIAAALTVAALCTSCLAESAEPADGIDITFNDVAPDASTIRTSAVLPDNTPRTNNTPRTDNARFDNRAHVAGSSMGHPTSADPDAAKRQFFLAWVRVTMPTEGPGQRGAVSAVFTPQPGADSDYWKVSEGAVLCDKGKPSVRGTNLSQIDCGARK